MGLIAFLIVLFVGGLIIGALARLALPGPDPMSIPMTAVLGIAGSLLGGIVSRIFLGYAGGFIFALAGAILLL
ncbi:MAG: GlsB/YeaQ/YmgE family stress response membrane protein [Gaiellaceae bacterium]